MENKPYIMNLGGFPIVIPAGKKVMFTQVGDNAKFDLPLPPVFGPTTIFLRCESARDQEGHSYATNVMWMEDDVAHV